MATSTTVAAAKYQLPAGRSPNPPTTNRSKQYAAPATDAAATNHRPRKPAARG